MLFVKWGSRPLGNPLSCFHANRFLWWPFWIWTSHVFNSQLWWQRHKFTFHKWIFCFVFLKIRSWMERQIFTSNCVHEISRFWIDKICRLLNNFYWLECPGSGTSSTVYYKVVLHMTWQLKVQDVVQIMHYKGHDIKSLKKLWSVLVAYFGEKWL